MSFFDKIKSGLTKTRDSIGSVFSASQLDDDFYDELEESLILADIGGQTAMEAVDALREVVKDQRLKKPEEAREALRDILGRMLRPMPSPPRARAGRTSSSATRPAACTTSRTS